MPLPLEVVIVLCIMCGAITILCILFFAFQIMQYQLEYNRRNNQIIPVSRLIRLQQLRRQIYEIQSEEHYKQQQKVNEEIKNSVIFINPDHTMQIGFKS
jgi:hypothetical protein